MVEETEYFVDAFEPLQSTLRNGSTGGNVRKLQETLNVFGAGLAVDGIFGPKTEAAVRAFQKAHKLDVDGIVGPKTWEALDAYKLDDKQISGIVDAIAAMYTGA